MPRSGIRPVGMPKAATNRRFGFLRIDFDIGDHLRIAQAQMGPGLAGVGGFIHAIAHGKIGPDDAGAAADVDDVGVGRRDRDGADGAGGLVIEERNPGGPVIGGAPDAAVIEADIEDIRLAGHARKRARAAGPGRPDGPPVHLGIKFGIDGLSRGNLRQRGQTETESETMERHSWNRQNGQPS